MAMAMRKQNSVSAAGVSCSTSFCPASEWILADSASVAESVFFLPVLPVRLIPLRLRGVSAPGRFSSMF